MGDVTYTLLGGIYPYGDKSAIGAGIINTNSNDIALTNIDGSSAGAGQWE